MKPDPQSTDVSRLVDHLFRHQAGQIVATLTRVFGPSRLDLAEDVVQETLIKALRTWPYRGVPDNPAGWIVRVARNHALDILRREQNLAAKQDVLAHLVAPATEPSVDLNDGLRDDMLRMIFMCCHPALSREARVALTLKTLGGFGVPELARAFLTGEPTVAQRLVRAKKTLRERNVQFDLPDADELPARLDSVLDVLYLLFNEGYSAHAGENLVRHELCEEALRLVSIVATHPAGDRPKIHALRALMLLQAARLPARVDRNGDVLLLDEQDRSRWDRGLIAQGVYALDRSAQGDALSAYHLEAGIAACHAVAPSYAATNWPRILAQYDALLVVAPSPVVALNRCVALAMVAGPAAALEALAPLEQEPDLRDYYLLHSTAAALLHRLGDNSRASERYTRALALATTAPEQRFLQRKIAALAR